ncbi:hypothetical protein [Streptomyces spinoverrucosus]|nr:hypothetical protein [Streptomyces spinoverrucosus]
MDLVYRERSPVDWAWLFSHFLLEYSSQEEVIFRFARDSILTCDIAATYKGFTADEQSMVLEWLKLNHDRHKGELGFPGEAEEWDLYLSGEYVRVEFTERLHQILSQHLEARYPEFLAELELASRVVWYGSERWRPPNDDQNGWIKLSHYPLTMRADDYVNEQNRAVPKSRPSLETQVPPASTAVKGGGRKVLRFSNLVSFQNKAKSCGVRDGTVSNIIENADGLKTLEKTLHVWWAADQKTIRVEVDLTEREETQEVLANCAVNEPVPFVQIGENLIIRKHEMVQTFEVLRLAEYPMGNLLCVARRKFVLLTGSAVDQERLKNSLEREGCALQSTHT